VHAGAGRAARPGRHAVGDRWQLDETNGKAAGRWRYLDRAIDHPGQLIDVFVSARRDVRAARRLVQQAIGATKVTPAESRTDLVPLSPAVLAALLPVAWQRSDQAGAAMTSWLLRGWRPGGWRLRWTSWPWSSAAARSSRLQLARADTMQQRPDG
jgi:transposase-like protein